jgi:PAS domain S-box-containing protein
MKGVTIITKGKNTRDMLHNQLNDLIGDKVRVSSYYIDGNIKHNIKDDLIILSSIETSKEALEYYDSSCRTIIARRSINYNEVDKIFDIRPGTDVLLVNDLKSSTFEAISLLKALGINHINYFPYYPGIDDFPELKIAVTPGERELVPGFVEDVIDIKTRYIDITTLVEVFKHLELLDEKANILSARYIKNIIYSIQKIRSMAALNDKMRNQLQTIINTVYDGIVAIDEKSNISVFNPIAEDIFNTSQDKVIGRNLRDKSSIGGGLASLLKSAGTEAERLVKINEKYVVINSSVIKEKEADGGIVYTLKDVTEIQRLEEELRRKLRSQKNQAKYTFADIVGKSTSIINTKKLAQKIADSNSPILIQGESGTGKEFFAQAIHNASMRKMGPFVAVNFAALPESLLDSELFGYEEGAFTGAKKGGMPGLFEQAHGGTIFLDEIADSPLSFQIRLLRVLQEKQVRRIGGSKVIPIDVRVISATNKDLRKLIGDNTFRQDLYFRLNVLPLKIPPLRDRSDDIIALAEAFYDVYFKGRPKLKPEEYFCKVKEAFFTYSWPGNIRELHNIVEYLSNICPDISPDLDVLPEELSCGCEYGNGKELREEDETITTVLKEIEQANRKREPIGRRSLSIKTGLSEGKIRSIINEIRRRGLINVNIGVKGIYISSEGSKLINGKRELKGNEKG